MVLQVPLGANTKNKIRQEVFSFMLLSDAKENFLIFKETTGLLPKSLDNYSSFISMFLEDLGNLELEELDKEIINTYILKIMQKNVTVATKSTYVRNLKIFLRWLEMEYNLELSAKKIKVPKTPKKILNIYTVEEIKTIFSSVTGETEWIVYRNKAIISLMLDSGLRQGEICGLKVKNLSFKNSTVKVLGKGNKERLVPVGNVSIKFLEMYCKTCPYDINKYVFLDRYGDLLTNNAVKLFMSKIANKLDFPFSFFLLRHNFATNFCIMQYKNNGKVDLYQLAVLMGHEDIKTTMKYLHLAQQIMLANINISYLDSIGFVGN